MDYFAQQLINGLSLGAIYGLIALGYSLVYGILQLINFAHGDVFMAGAFVAVIAILALAPAMALPVALILALLIAMLVAAVLGFAIERMAYHPLRNAPRLAPLLSAVGVSIFLQNFVQLAHGARVKPLPPMIPGALGLWEGKSGFTVSISYVQILILAATALLVALFTWLIQSTSLGRAQRAVAEDRTMAALLGIPVARVMGLTFALGGALAAVAGMMVALNYGVIDFYMGFMAGLKAFTAAVLGGIGSLPGAVLGGLLLGCIESLWSAYGIVEYKDLVVFGVLILVLLVRPSGLLGKPALTKV